MLEEISKKKAKVYSKSWNYNYFIQFDIANFYDCINLNILEKKVRCVISNKQKWFVDLLFFFLKNQNKDFIWYNEKWVGLPQDEIGDCSRILANFYLQDYDDTLKNIADKLDVKYLRYADDQLIFSKDKKSAEQVLFEASKELHKIWLNINSSKVKIFENKDTFNTYRAFEIFDLLWDKNDIKNIERAIDIFFDLELKWITFKKDSVLNRFLSCNLWEIDISKRIKLLSIFCEEKYLANASSFVLQSIYTLLSDNGMKEDFLQKLMDLSNKVLFNSYHYNLLRLHDEINDSIIDPRQLKSRIEIIKFKK